MFRRTLIPLLKNEWRIIIKFMHGDADSYSYETLKYKTEEAFLKDAKEIPSDPWKGGRKIFDAWAEKNFEDRPFQNESSYELAAFDGAAFFHYDENGEQWELTKS